MLITFMSSTNHAHTWRDWKKFTLQSSTVRNEIHIATSIFKHWKDFIHPSFTHPLVHVVLFALTMTVAELEAFLL